MRPGMTKTKKTDELQEKKEKSTGPKYMLLKNNIQRLEVNGETIVVFQIKATQNFGKGRNKVRKGMLGGFVQNKENLGDNCWIRPGTIVCQNARILGAPVVENSLVAGNCTVMANAYVKGVKLMNNVRVSGKAKVIGNDSELSDKVVTGNETLYL